MQSEPLGRDASQLHQTATPGPSPSVRGASPEPARPQNAGPKLWVASAALATLAVDAALGAHGWPSLVLTALEAALLPAWAADLARMTASPGPAQPTERRGRRGGKLPTRAVIAAVSLLALSCWGVKLWIAWGSLASPDALTPSYRTFTVGLAAILALGTLGRPRRIQRFLALTSEHPARLMASSFGLSALAGAFLLSLPVAFRTQQTSSFLDALFTSVSAVCLTGLTVNNVALTYSRFGQGVILVLIQIGGLGIMVLSAFFGIIAGRKLAARSAAVLAEMIDADSMASFRRHLASIVLFTFAYEAAGAAALYFAFSADPELALSAMPDATGSTADLVWASIFHSVSAFCNAGLSIFQAGALPFAAAWGTCSVLMTLILLGGLGFPVHAELLRQLADRVRRRPRKRFSLHARVVLIASGVLVLTGTLVFALLEWNRSMADLPFHARLLASLFQSVTTRTAGYNTLDFAAMAPATLVLSCLLMFIGGSPGSTAGGVKTSTVAALFAYFRAELRGTQQAVLLDRALPEFTLRRAVGVTSLSLVITTGLIVLLCLLEPHDPLHLIFEAVSAFATVGLSTGITPELGAFGKIVIIGAMFVGRIGPLTLALLFAERARRLHYRRPEERVAIG